MPSSTVMGYLCGCDSRVFRCTFLGDTCTASSTMQATRAALFFGGLILVRSGVAILVFRLVYTPRVIELGGEASYVCAACVVDI